MFQKDTEKKIIELIKKSPIGVTSSEIAKYLGISRITITKYLAIIKEKALIDFKQFGMAKMWFIPLELNKETYLKKISTDIAINLYKADKEGLIKTGIIMGKHIKTLYKDHFRTDKLSKEQTIEAIKDAYEKIGGKISLIKEEHFKLLFTLKKSPFQEKIDDSIILSGITLGTIGELLKNINGYAKICLKPPIEKEPYRILAYIRKTKESEKETEGIEFIEEKNEF